jgi:hypothetical protein
MKPILLDERKLRWKVVKPVRHVSIMAVTGMAAFLTFVNELSGTTPELQVAQSTSAYPGQWLLDDVARARAKYVHAHKHKGLRRSITASGRRPESGRTSADWDPLDADWVWWYWQ